MPLTILKFLTSLPVCDFMPLGAFRNSSISKRCDIRFFHEEGNIRADDIKYLASKRVLMTISPGCTWSEVKSLLSKTAVLRQKPTFYTICTGRDRLHLMSLPCPDRELRNIIMSLWWDGDILWKLSFYHFRSPKLSGQLNIQTPLLQIDSIYIESALYNIVIEKSWVFVCMEYLWPDGAVAAVVWLRLYAYGAPGCRRMEPTL